MAEVNVSRLAALQNDFEDLLIDREVKIVDEMVLAYRSSRATFEVLLGSVAKIAELRRIRDEMERNLLNEVEKAETKVI